MMIDIASSLNHIEFDEVKDCPTTFHMWKKVEEIFGGDDNVRRAKEKNLRGQFDQMKMREDENIVKYSERIKASVNAIKFLGGISMMSRWSARYSKLFFLFMQLECQLFKR